MKAYIPQQQGLGLVELMVSVAIGVTILIGALNVYTDSTKSQKGNDESSRVQENMRVVMRSVETDIARSGFTGCIAYEDLLVRNLLADDVGPGELFNIAEGFIRGENDTGPGVNGLTSTDKLMVRYVSPSNAIKLTKRSSGEEDITIDESHNHYTNLEQYDVIMVSDCSTSAIFMITNDPQSSDGLIQRDLDVTAPVDHPNEGQSNISNDLEAELGIDETKGSTPGASMAYLYTDAGAGTVEYEIRDSVAAGILGKTCLPTSPEYCGLYRNDEEIAEGIEDLQLEFGWQDDDSNLYFNDADNILDWTVIDRVKITLSINSGASAAQVPGATTVGERVLIRKTFSQTSMIRNQLSSD